MSYITRILCTYSSVCIPVLTLKFTVQVAYTVMKC